VESVESQQQASPSFHESLGNLATSRRDSHIPTAPAARPGGKVENQKQVSHFPTAPILISLNQNSHSQTLTPVQRGALRGLAHDIYKFGNIFS
jgi:hypothetical protein